MDESFSNFWEVTKSVFIPLEVTESVARQIFNCGWKARDREVQELRDDFEDVMQKYEVLEANDISDGLDDDDMNHGET